MTTTRRTTPLARSCDAPHSCPEPLRLQVLAHAPYFRTLSSTAIQDIDRRMHVRGYQSGEVIYRAGQPATHRRRSWHWLVTQSA